MMVSIFDYTPLGTVVLTSRDYEQVVTTRSQSVLNDTRTIKVKYQYDICQFKNQRMFVVERIHDRWRRIYDIRRFLAQYAKAKMENSEYIIYKDDPEAVGILLKFATAREI